MSYIIFARQGQWLSARASRSKRYNVQYSTVQNVVLPSGELIECNDLKSKRLHFEGRTLRCLRDDTLLAYHHFLHQRCKINISLNVFKSSLKWPSKVHGLYDRCWRSNVKCVSRDLQITLKNTLMWQNNFFFLHIIIYLVFETMKQWKINTFLQIISLYLTTLSQ